VEVDIITNFLSEMEDVEGMFLQFFYGTKGCKSIKHFKSRKGEQIINSVL